jgi:hypothetical protein
LAPAGTFPHLLCRQHNKDIIIWQNDKCKESGDFFCNWHFFIELSDKYAKISKNTLFLDAYLYNRERKLCSETFSGTNSGRNVPGNSPGGWQDTKTVPGTVPFPGKNQKITARCGQKRIKRIQHILYNRNTMKLTLIEDTNKYS